VGGEEGNVNAADVHLAIASSESHLLQEYMEVEAAETGLVNGMSPSSGCSALHGGTKCEEEEDISKKASGKRFYLFLFFAANFGADSHFYFCLFLMQTLARTQHFTTLRFFTPFHFSHLPPHTQMRCSKCHTGYVSADQRQRHRGPVRRLCCRKCQRNNKKQPKTEATGVIAISSAQSSFPPSSPLDSAVVDEIMKIPDAAKKLLELRVLANHQQTVEIETPLTRLPDLVWTSFDRTCISELNVHLYPDISALVLNVIGTDTESVVSNGVLPATLTALEYISEWLSLMSEDDVRVSFLEEWFSTTSRRAASFSYEVTQIMLKTILKHWHQFPVDKVPLRLMAEPIVYLPNGDLLVEGDVFITQSTFHGVDLRKLSTWSATYDRGEFLLDEQGNPLCPDPLLVDGLEVWATSREHPLYPTRGGYGGCSVEGVSSRVINCPLPNQTLTEQELQCLDLNNAYRAWRADGPLATKLNKSDNFASHGHPILGHGFPMLLPIVLLKGKKEGDVFDVRMVVNRLRQYDAPVPSVDSPDRQVCTVRLRCRQGGYHCGLDWRCKTFEQTLLPFTQDRY